MSGPIMDARFHHDEAFRLQVDSETFINLQVQRLQPFRRYNHIVAANLQHGGRAHIGLSSGAHWTLVDKGTIG